MRSLGFPTRERSARWIAAFLAVAVALLLRGAVDPWLGPALPLATMFGAVAFVVWIGGYGPALLAAALGYLSVDYFFVEPRHVLGVSATFIPGVVAYALSCGLIVGLGESMRRAQARVEVTGAALREAHARLQAAASETESREARLRFVTDAAPMLISYVNAECRYLQLNRAYETWFDRPRNEVAGKTMREVLGEEAWQTIRPHVEAALAGREERYESLVTYPNGPRWIQAAYVPDVDADGRVLGFVALVHDVTARKAAEMALRESEEKFRRIVETANEGIWLLDENARVTFVNRRMSSLIGYSPDEMMGRPKWDFLLGQDRERVRELFARRRAGISEQLDVCFQHRDGRPVWMLMAAQPMLDENGVFRGTLDMFTDVTERKRLEGELEARLADLARSDRRKDEFIATLSHELRNPLAPIRNAVALLRELPASDPQIESVRGLLERQVDQLTRLTDDLLDASRISRNKLELRRERVELADVIHSAVETSRPEIEAGGHALEVSLPRAPVFLDADPTRMAQVFTNLLNNAAGYTPSGGRIRVSAWTRDDEVTVCVEDTGIGIEPEHLPGLFDLFSQVNTALDRPRGGLGIGLALVRGLVGLHGGTVEARSAGLGKGSEFRVTIPLARTPLRATQEVPRLAPEPTARPRRLLVVDDNRDSAESLALLLRRRGHEVREAYEGHEALALASEFRPDVVLLDIGLPGMSGYEVARRIRREPWGGGVCLVAVTGWGQEGDKRRSREAGIDHHLTKPVDLTRLAELLDATAPPD